MSPRVPVKKATKRPGAPDLPLGPGPPHTIRTPQRGGNRHPTRGVRSRHVSAGGGTRARPRRFPGKARPPTAFNAVGEGALHCRARGDFCQAVLLTARYQGAQCSRWCHPRHARQSATPARHNSSATEYHNSYAVDPQSTPQPTLPQRASRRWDKTPSVRESTGRRSVSSKRSSNTVTPLESI